MNTVIALLAVLGTVCGILVTISLFIVNGLRENLKDLSSSMSSNGKALWEAVNQHGKDLSDFKEYVAMSHPREERVNEKLEVNRQHLDQALSGITHRLTKLESDQDTAIRGIQSIAENQQTSNKLLLELLESKKRSS